MPDWAADSFQSLESLGLPIFRAETPLGLFYYTPGRLLRLATGLQLAFESALLARQHTYLDGPAERLVQAARQAQAAWVQWQHPHYEPVCLALYLNQNCNLNCVYCFSDLDRRRDDSLLEPAAVQAAAEKVAENCARAGKPLAVIFHGGGEPVLAWQSIERIFPVLEQAAQRWRVPLFSHISTNGVMAEERAAWLAGRFDDICLSADGPPEIQDVQRPIRAGGASSCAVERTAAVLHRLEKTFSLRVTITPHSAAHQVEIAEYFCRVIRPTAIRIEPVYNGRSGWQEQLSPEDAYGFVRAYRQAQETARGYGIDWSLSGARPGEVHGAYCQIFRGVLHLLPGGAATACFKTINSAKAREVDLDIGGYQAGTQSFELDCEHIQALQNRYTLPAACRGCINVFHCAHTCPDACLLTGDVQHPSESSEFTAGCLIRRELTAVRLLEAGCQFDPGVPVAEMAFSRIGQARVDG